MNIVLIKAVRKDYPQEVNKFNFNVMLAQLKMLGLTFHAVDSYTADNYERSFMVEYRTDHELVQVKRVAAYHKQGHIIVLDNVRVTGHHTIASGGFELATHVGHGIYAGDHTEQVIEFHASRPAEDCIQLPMAYGGLYITVKQSK